ncbi:hypothetical protein [Alteromonas sp. H39]|uniref:hypothetical protein n=1 Tax=Alteromonas sp. H39 TaxID=3389876 RepID=UPI0039E191FF
MRQPSMLCKMTMSQPRISLLMLFFIVVSPAAVLADESSQPAVQRLSIPHQVDTTYGIHNYIVEVLTRALALTEQEYGPFLLVGEQEAAVQSRQLRNLEEGVSDIIWMISDRDREQQSRAIPIPIIGGFYGYRVLLVREHDNRFLRSPKLPELRQLLYAQGADWPDTRILINNDFNVEMVTYKAGFRMLQRGFVDAYPRAVHEALFELTQPITDNLTIEPYTLMVYPNPLFFYVASWNTELADRLESGLKIMVRSGELQSRLESQAFYQTAYDVLAGRTIYKLHNPILSDTARVAVEQYLDFDEVLEYVSNSTVKKTPRKAFSQSSSGK